MLLPAEIAKNVLRRVGIKVSRAWPEPWNSDPEYLAIRATIAGRTTVTEPRLYFLWQCAKQTAHLMGDAAELGVFRGGASRLIASAAPTRRLHLFDTFAGNPSGDFSVDGGRANDTEFRDTSVEAVRAFLARCNVEFHPGLFPATAETVRDRSFSFVFLDADLYDSIKAGCEFFYPRMVAGGIIVVDDYGVPFWPGTKRAVEEYFAQKKERVVALPFLQAMIVKLPDL